MEEEAKKGDQVKRELLPLHLTPLVTGADIAL
jgi:hypothetical protein